MKKLTYKYVKEQIESVEGYKLLSKEYIGSCEYLKVQCNKKHTYKVTWICFQQGQRCPYCYGNVKLTYDFVKSQIEKEGYKLLSTNYVNAYVKLKVQCDKGHIYYPIYNNFKKGTRCSICNGGIGYNYEYVKKQIESVKGYKLLSNNYKNNHNKIKIQCDKGHIYKVRWNDFKTGNRCPICCSKYSKLERKVFKIVKHLLPNENIIENDRTQIINPLTNHNLELDIWIPELKKAIEFNGEYWHSSDYSKYKDSEKVKQCKEKGINLLVINERNWISNKSNEINKIKNWINK